MICHCCQFCRNMKANFYFIFSLSFAFCRRRSFFPILCDRIVVVNGWSVKWWEVFLLSFAQIRTKNVGPKLHTLDLSISDCFFCTLTLTTTSYRGAEFQPHELKIRTWPMYKRDSRWLINNVKWSYLVAKIINYLMMIKYKQHSSL